MATGTLIIVRPANPNHAVFRVLRISRNGWLTCQLYGGQDGSLTRDGFVCKWRSSEVELWNGGK